MKKRAVFLGSALIVILFTNLVFFKVHEQEVVVIVQFGKVVKEIAEPGLYAKLPEPFQAILRFSVKKNVFESTPSEVLSSDKKNLLVNIFVVWRFADPINWFITVRHEKQALLCKCTVFYPEK